MFDTDAQLPGLAPGGLYDNVRPPQAPERLTWVTLTYVGTGVSQYTSGDPYLDGKQLLFSVFGATESSVRAVVTRLKAVYNRGLRGRLSDDERVVTVLQGTENYGVDMVNPDLTRGSLQYILQTEKVMETPN